MGCKILKDYKDGFTFEHPIATKMEWSNRFKDNIEANVFSTFFDPFYDNDWNRLMEVVEKIKNLGFKFNCFLTDEKSYVSFADWTETKIHSFVCIGANGKEYNTENNSKEAVYNACVEFIKWYNQQSK